MLQQAGLRLARWRLRYDGAALGSPASALLSAPLATVTAWETRRFIGLHLGTELTELAWPEETVEAALNASKLLDDRRRGFEDLRADFGRYCRCTATRSSPVATFERWIASGTTLPS